MIDRCRKMCSNGRYTDYILLKLTSNSQFLGQIVNIFKQTITFVIYVCFWGIFLQENVSAVAYKVILPFVHERLQVIFTLGVRKWGRRASAGAYRTPHNHMAYPPQEARKSGLILTVFCAFVSVFLMLLV